MTDDGAVIDGSGHLRSAPVTIPLSPGRTLPGLLLVPAHARACYVMAHGAGAGMEHRFMGAVAAGLASRSIATLRYQFPYMDAGSKRPDNPPTAHAAVRAAVTAAAWLIGAVPLIAGGKSFGGRMTSQAQAVEALPGVIGLAFLGFPLHPAGKPSRARAEHLSGVDIPMLFLQGRRDALAEPNLLTQVVAGLGTRATLWLDDAADHAFHVPARSGRTDAAVLASALDTMVAWIATLPTHEEQR